jgi:catechol 2,3-dioxygenase-like lactoylglutathione lyase family enzyme
MKMNSVSSFRCYVRDLSKTVEFYAKIGFKPGKDEPDFASFYLNWFSLEFVPVAAARDGLEADDAAHEPKGAGAYFNIRVADAEEFHAGLLELGLTPESEPIKRPNGQREFILRDPDGYKLLIFDK